MQFVSKLGQFQQLDFLNFDTESLFSTKQRVIVLFLEKILSFTMYNCLLKVTKMSNSIFLDLDN